MVVFQAHLLENIVVCLLMQGKVTLAGSTVWMLYIACGCGLYCVVIVTRGDRGVS